MEASALQAPAGLARTRITIGAPLLRLRSDEQLVAQFRAGSEEAFRVIHDRYRQRLFAYTRQMLSSCRQDAEDALQDVFVRAYSGLRADDRQLALRAWLYRVAHNRCIDELRRPVVAPAELAALVRAPVADPIDEAERRESLRRLLADVRRLPAQQRSALLMRELGGMPYLEIACAIGVTVPAVKSLLVRARMSLAQAALARDTACAEIRDELVSAHDRGVRPSGLARRHMHDCRACCEFRRELRGISRGFAALGPTLGPFGALANLLGIGGGASGGAGAVSGSAGVASGGLAAVSFGGAAAGGAAGHIATLLAAAVITVGGAVELRHATPAGGHGSGRQVTHARQLHGAGRAVAREAAVAGTAAGGAGYGQTSGGGEPSTVDIVGTTSAGAPPVAAGTTAGSTTAGAVDELDPAANGQSMVDPTAADATSAATPAAPAAATPGAAAQRGGGVTVPGLLGAVRSGGSGAPGSGSSATASGEASASGTATSQGGASTSTSTTSGSGSTGPGGGASTTSTGGAGAASTGGGTSATGTSTGSQPQPGATGGTSTGSGSTASSSSSSESGGTGTAAGSTQH